MRHQRLRLHRHPDRHYRLCSHTGRHAWNSAEPVLAGSRLSGVGTGRCGGERRHRPVRAHQHGYNEYAGSKRRQSHNAVRRESHQQVADDPAGSPQRDANCTELQSSEGGIAIIGGSCPKLLQLGCGSEPTITATGRIKSATGIAIIGVVPTLIAREWRLGLGRETTGLLPVVDTAFETAWQGRISGIEPGNGIYGQDS